MLGVPSVVRRISGKEVACAAVEVLEGSSLAGASSASQSFNALARRAKALKDLEGSSLAGASHAFLAGMVLQRARIRRLRKVSTLAGVAQIGPVGQVQRASDHTDMCPTGALP
jgi:hypothetical protein